MLAASYKMFTLRHYFAPLRDAADIHADAFCHYAAAYDVTAAMLPPLRAMLFRYAMLLPPPLLVYAASDAAIFHAAYYCCFRASSF